MNQINAIAWSDGRIQTSVGSNVLKAIGSSYLANSVWGVFDKFDKQYLCTVYLVSNVNRIFRPFHNLFPKMLRTYDFFKRDNMLYSLAC